VCVHAFADIGRRLDADEDVGRVRPDEPFVQVLVRVFVDVDADVADGGRPVHALVH